MNAEDLARILDGREMGSEITDAECNAASDAGLVVVFGYSDDNAEFRGAITDEIGAYDRTEIAITPSGVLGNLCDDDRCPYYRRKWKSSAKLTASFGDTGWTFRCSWPHSTFRVFEDGELFGIGIVFRLADVPAVEEAGK